MINRSSAPERATVPSSVRIVWARGPDTCRVKTPAVAHVIEVSSVIGDVGAAAVRSVNSGADLWGAAARWSIDGGTHIAATIVSQNCVVVVWASGFVQPSMGQRNSESAPQLKLGHSGGDPVV